MALVRDRSRVPAEIARFCDVIDVDLRDRGALIAATVDVDALYWVCPQTGADDPIAGYVETGTNAVAAVEANGIERVVFQSSGGAEHRGGFGEIDGLAAVEEMFDTTLASVLHLRCGYFFSNLGLSIDALRNGVLATTLPLDQRLPWVAPADIAQVAVSRLVNTSWNGRHVQGVYGPADLSFVDAARIVSGATGKPVEPYAATDDEVASALTEIGLTPAQAAGIVGMSAGMREHPEYGISRDAMSTTPTTLESWAYDTLRPLLEDTSA